MKQLLTLTICMSGKQAYQDEHHAEGAIERGAVRGVELRKYRCPDCKMYHVSRVERRKELQRMRKAKLKRMKNQSDRSHKHT